MNYVKLKFKIDQIVGFCLLFSHFLTMIMVLSQALSYFRHM